MNQTMCDVVRRLTAQTGTFKFGPSLFYFLWLEYALATQKSIAASHLWVKTQGSLGPLSGVDNQWSNVKTLNSKTEFVLAHIIQALKILRKLRCTARLLRHHAETAIRVRSP